jgi:glutamine---fructose-6-phosphate transaminase (isomerizing)
LTDTERRILQGRYLADILAQPAALQATLDSISIPGELLDVRERLQENRLKRIVLTGMGSSFYCLLPVAIALSNYGYEVVQAETSELIHYLPGLLNPESLVIAVSQSGRSAEIIRLLELNARKATVLAVTNNPDSPLALYADARMLTAAGEEFSVSSKTYVCTLAVMQTIAGILCQQPASAVHSELLQSVPATAAYLTAWEQHVLELAPYLEGMHHLFFVGRGGSMAAAATGALITKESVRVHAEALSSAAFRHGPMEMLGKASFVAVLEGDGATRGLNENLVRDIRATPAGGQLIGSHAELHALRLPPCNPRIAPILEFLPFEILTLSLGYLAAIEAGVFQRGTKVTVIE